jgi:hypothetical protein
LDVGPSGRIERVFGRKGRGPGEFVSPASMAVAGDSLLAVFDRSARRITMVDLRTWTLGPIVPVQESGPPTMQFAGPDLLVRSWDWDTKTSVATVELGGRVTRREGIIPPIGLKHPMLLQGAFGNAVFAVSGDDMFAMFEVSPSLYRWKRGSREAQEIHLPAARRRGVDPTLFETLLRDPGRARELIYSRSVPVVLERVSDEVLAILTMDVTLEKDLWNATHHLTLFDYGRNRVCPDLAIPATRQMVSMGDGLSKAAVRGDTLVLLEPSPDANGEPVPTLRRFRIDRAQCPWTSLPGAAP